MSRHQIRENLVASTVKCRRELFIERRNEIFYPVMLCVDAVIWTLNGFVLQLLWGWFIVTTFAAFKIPPLALPQAVGIVAIFHLLATQYVPTDDSLIKTIAGAMSQGVITPIFALVVGWIAHLCM